MKTGNPEGYYVPGNVQATRLVHTATPVYPPRAKKGGIQGIVVLEALIGKDGKVEKLRYVSGPSLLLKSTIEAVRQWRYRPTLLNGRPVEVNTKISVTYTLAETCTDDP